MMSMVELFVSMVTSLIPFIAIAVAIEVAVTNNVTIEIAVTNTVALSNYHHPTGLIVITPSMSDCHCITHCLTAIAS